MTPIKHPENLWAIIEEHFGLRLPRKVWTAGHSTPLDFIWDAISNPGRDIAVWANRSGLKTLSASIVAALEFHFGKGPLRARVLSGSEEQARNLYEYWQRWCDGLLSRRLLGSPGRQITRLDNGDFEILSASQKRVRGAKVQRLFRDEIDETDADLLAASVGMLAARDGLPARTIDTSTWHRADGPMGRLVASADRGGVHLHKWNVWEVIENCPPERHEHGRGCRSCALGPVCVAKAREVHGEDQRELGLAADCDGLLAIDDAIRQFRRWSRPQWEAEAECRRPSVEGRVYADFDRAVHVRDGLLYEGGLETCRAIDWGWRDFVCLWVQSDKSGCVRVVDEYWATNGTTKDNARHVLARSEGMAVEATYCDPAGRNVNDQTGYSDVEAFGHCGIECTYNLSRWAREVANGIDLIRAFLRPADGGTRLLISDRCRRLIEAFEGYRNRQVNGQYVDEPIKPQPHDHGMDALRYYFVNRRAPNRTETRRVSYV
ncbi:MAG TPA: hypothetical protein VM695_09580 [Phycisphaerae bacterium]|nr:hypothetical protein [Phycisphaerae bacterium]